MYKLSLQYSPNNETRLTLYKDRAKRGSLLEQASELLGATCSELVPSGERSEDLPYLDIRSEFRTTCQAHKYKRTKFGLYAKRRIMRAGGAMDKHDAIASNYLFLTATLPSDEDFAKWAIAEESHNIVDGLKSWLSKMQGNRLEFYVWEHQGRAALHLHYCIHVPCPDVRRRITVGFARQWMRLLDRAGERSGVDMWGKHSPKSIDEKLTILQTNVQQVHTSVAAYMAGYCGGTKNKHEDDHKKDYYPRRWWGVSRPLSTLIAQKTHSEIISFSNYRIAKLKMMDFECHFSIDSLTTRNYLHKVGDGETTVFYHLSEVCEQLWQEKLPMKVNRKLQPNAWSFLSLLASIQSTCLELQTGSQLFRQLSSKLAVDCLLDVLYLDSLQRGQLRSNQVRAAESLWLYLSSQSSLPPTLENLQAQLRAFCLLHSQHFNQMTYDRNGWMNLSHDFADTVDIQPEQVQAGTTCEEQVAPSSVDGSRGHVPCEPTDEFIQSSIPWI